ncbi:cupin domain-containing protein [Niabella soli]|uniref:Cupin n=1 Tax=Niabella soli DSM 19437 TaxID=929713 RepID=W0F145_9BACT|nr:cupin domain-containing protein [Niabella soli]AHF15558.1 cupin [Niabella soli DSM 19437]
MPTRDNKIVSGAQPLHSYIWGRDCTAAVLTDNASLSIKQETIPTGNGEQLHFHHTAVQFFFILKGRAGFEIDAVFYTVNANEGILIYPGQKHRVFNEGMEELEFIVYSQPSTNNDRVNL